MNFNVLEFVGLITLVGGITIALINVIPALAYAIGHVIYDCLHVNLHYVRENNRYVRLVIMPLRSFIEGFVEGFFSPITTSRSSKWIWCPPFTFIKVLPKSTIIINENHED